MYSLSLTLCEQPKVLTHRRSVPGTLGEEDEEKEEEEGRVEEGEVAPQLTVIVVVVMFPALPTICSLSVPTSDTEERGGDADAGRWLAVFVVLLLLLLLVLLPLLPLFVEILRGRTTSPTAGCA